MEKLKQRWGVSSNLQLFVIFVVFAITGSTAVKIARPVLEYIGFTKDIFPEHWVYMIPYYIVRIAIIFPIYQILLMVFGTLLGQYKFFWAFEKKMLRRIGFKSLLKE